MSLEINYLTNLTLFSIDKMPWEILHSGVDLAQNHMDKDQKLLQEISSIGHPLLHFYDWMGPSATYGYFIDPLNFLRADGIEKLGLQLARRPTGGGIVFHWTDLTFSVLIPASHPAYSLNTLDNYAYVNKKVIQAIHQFRKGIQATLLSSETKPLDVASGNFCMAKPTIYDVMVEGKKVGGAAQRRTKSGFLHQGTISIAMPEETDLRAVLKQETYVLEAMKNQSYVLMTSKVTSHQLEEVRDELRHLLKLAFL